MIDYGKTKVKQLPVLISDTNIFCEGGGRLLSDIIYPVGSIYISVVDVNPSTYFGGVWEAFATGKTLVGINPDETEFNTILKEGGAKTHTLTTAQLPAHTHSFSATTSSAGAHTHKGNTKELRAKISGQDSNDVARPIGSSYDYKDKQLVTSAGAHTHTISGTSGSTGGASAHNNLQPYIVVYMWRRIS